jgi:protein ImuB
MRRVISLWLPHWPTDRIRRGRPASRAPDRPLAAIAAEGGRAVIAAVNGAAAACGIAPGLSLADARARLPDLATIRSDPAGDAAALGQLALWCRRYTPIVALDGADGLWLDITGCAHLFGGEDVLLDDLKHRLAGFGVAARLGLADTPGAAWAVARHGQAAIVEPGAMRTALAGLSVAGLRLLPSAVETLMRLGLRRIGDLYPMPRAPLAARFGGGMDGRTLAAGVVRRLDQALGRAEEAIAPLHPAPELRERLAFAEPILTAEAIAGALDTLLSRLARALERSQKGVRRLDLDIYRADGVARCVAIGTSRATRDRDALFRLFREKLDNIDPGFGIDAIALSAPVAERLGAMQIALPPERGAMSDTSVAAAGAVAPLIDRLANRLGERAVFGLAQCDSHIPERAQRAAPALRPARRTIPPVRPPRPVRLFARPEPVEVVASVPDHPPALFRWRGAGHRVARAEGPERLAPEWWRGGGTLDPAGLAASTRDYYRVEDEAGRRFWLFRQGLYGHGAEPRWYLHGLFG